MKITNISLKGYVPFKDTGIKQLSADFTQAVQIVIGTNGSGKALSNDSLIQTPDGWKYMGEMEVGTKVTNPDGTSCTVTGVYPQGIKDIYRVTFDDGRFAECCEDHLWKIYNVHWHTLKIEQGVLVSSRSGWKVIPLKEIIAYQRNKDYKTKAGWFIELPSPELKDDVDLPLDPYVLGVILGDGSISESSIVITNPDDFIFQEVSRLIPSYCEVSIRATSSAHPCRTFSIRRNRQLNRSQKSSLASIFRAFNLNGKRSWEKYIPDAYMNASPSQRLSLLQGLMDTDGCVDVAAGRGNIEKILGKGGRPAFCTTSYQMALQVQRLVRSLGGMCKIAVKQPHFTYKGEVRRGRTAYNLSIRIKDPQSLFRLPRKKERLSDQYQYRDRLRLRIRNIEYIGRKKAQCITVDHPNKLYITNEFVVTHNSSLIRQLSLYPSVRSDFDDKIGYRSLTVEHQGSFYQLVSEYEKPSSPHAFIDVDTGENLNVGRTTQGQIDLLTDQLKITPLIDDLIMNRLTFPKMGNAERKKFLMNANPDQIGFVLPLIKQTSQKIKARKSTIAHLQSRKIMLEQDLVDDETLLALEQEKQLINEDLNHFQQNLMDLEVGLRTLSSGVTAFNIKDLASVQKTVKQAHYQLAGLSHVSRDDRQRQQDREKILTNIAVCQQRLEVADEEIIEKSLQLTEMEVKYRELTIDDDLHQTDLTIRRLEADRDQLQIPRPAFELSAEDLQTRYQELPELQERLQVFSHREVRLLPTKRRMYRERMLTLYQQRQSNYHQRLNELEAQYESLVKQHTIKPRDIPDSPCAKEACPLYRHFMGEFEQAEEKRQSILARLEKGRIRTDRIDRYVHGLSDYFHNTKPYTDQIQWLGHYASSNPILYHLLRQMDILAVLSTNPNRIGTALQEAYRQIDQWLKLKQVQMDLETAYALKARQISSESHDTIRLVSSIDEHKNALYGLRNAVKRLTTRRRQLDKDLHDNELFSHLKTTLLDIKAAHQTRLDEMSSSYEHDRLTLLRKGVSELRSRHLLRLSDIERVLRTQSGLRERYQEEIITQLGLIEKDLTDLQHIETALIAIPTKNMIGFINDVFDQTNRLLNSVWTVPLQLELLDPAGDLTYDFYVSGDNHTVREMNRCSDGQSEIISLCFNLALRIILGHLNLPLALDEVGKTFDATHRHHFITLLRRLLNDQIISQLFLISHDAVIHEGFADTETMVLREDNILLPSVYNNHVTIT